MSSFNCDWRSSGVLGGSAGASFSEPALVPFLVGVAFPAGAAAGSAFGAGAACFTAGALAGVALAGVALAGVALAGVALACAAFAGILVAGLCAAVAARDLCDFAFAFACGLAAAVRAGLWAFALATTAFAGFPALARAAGALRAKAFLACLLAVLLKMGASKKWAE